MSVLRQQEVEGLITRLPIKRSIRFLTLGPGDTWYLLAVATAAVYGRLYLGSSMMLIIIGFALVLFVDPEQLDSRLYVFIGTLIAEGWIKFVKKDKLLDRSSEEIAAEATAKISEKGRYLFSSKLYGFGDLGVIYTPKKHTDSLVFVGSGSNVVSQRLDEQFSFNENQGRTVVQIGAFRRWRFGVSYLMLRRPGNEWIGRLYQEENGHAEAILPSAASNGTPLEEWTEADYRWANLALLGDETMDLWRGENGKDVAMAMIVTIKRSRLLRRVDRLRLKQQRSKRKKHVDKGSLAADEFNRDPLMKVATLVKDRLEACGVTDVGVLNLGGITELIHKSWDCVGLPEYWAAKYQPFMKLDYERRGTLVQSASADEDEFTVSLANAGLQVDWDVEPEPVAPVTLGPFPVMNVTVGHNWICTDGTYHTTVRIVGDTPEQLPNEARYTYTAPNNWFSQAVVGEAVRTGAEYTVRHLLTTVAEGFIENGEVNLGPKGDIASEAQKERLNVIARLRSKVDANIAGSVSAASLEELELEFEKLRRHYVTLGKEIARTTWRSRQLAALEEATTAISQR